MVNKIPISDEISEPCSLFFILRLWNALFVYGHHIQVNSAAGYQCIDLPDFAQNANATRCSVLARSSHSETPCGVSIVIKTIQVSFVWISKSCLKRYHVVELGAQAPSELIDCGPHGSWSRWRNRCQCEQGYIGRTCCIRSTLSFIVASCASNSDFILQHYPVGRYIVFVCDIVCFVTIQRE